MFCVVGGKPDYINGRKEMKERSTFKVLLHKTLCYLKRTRDLNRTPLYYHQFKGLKCLSSFYGTPGFVHVGPSLGHTV